MNAGNGEAGTSGDASNSSEKLSFNGEGSLPQRAIESNLHVHVLKTASGVTVEATLDPETFQLTCRWNPPPPYSRKKFKRIAREYIPWRDAIMEEAAKRAGLRVMMVTSGISALPSTTIYGLKKETPS